MKKRISCHSPRSEAFLSAHRRAFAGYLTAGYPSREMFPALAARCAAAGLQILEIGFPSENPYCDGEVIRNAHRVIDRSLADDDGFWNGLRAAMDCPIWLMGYKADLLDTGRCRSLAEAGVMDCVVIPDLDGETRLALMEELAPLGVDVMGFIGDDQSDEENDRVLARFPLVYQRLYAGPTGELNDSDSYLPLLRKAKERAVGRVFAGFGISTCRRARELLQAGFDGVVIGTAIMKKLSMSQAELLRFIRALDRTTSEVR